MAASFKTLRRLAGPGRAGADRAAATSKFGAAILAACISVTLAAALYPAPQPGWQEIPWPFPRDAWPAGRAFRCRAASCGGEMAVYLRPKLGFCANCATGVTDDAEVDGVADLDMITSDFVPQAPGEHVVIGRLAGRTRTYALRFPDGATRPGAGFAVTRAGQCDLFVAASEGPAAGTPAGRRAIETLLATGPVADWISQRLGG